MNTYMLIYGNQALQFQAKNWYEASKAAENYCRERCILNAKLFIECGGSPLMETTQYDYGPFDSLDM